MSAVFFRVIIFLIIAGAIFLGARRIWRDWKGQFKKLDEANHQRDLRERERPDVITLKRDKDGTFRPNDDKS
jgi:hypothetical protein